MTASTVITPRYLEDRGTFQTITAMEAYSSKSIEVSSCNNFWNFVTLR